MPASRANHPVATNGDDEVRQLQRRLWVAAKRDPGRRFHALYDRIFRGDVLEEAWKRVRANRGSAGVDAQTLVEVEQYGVERFLEELGTELREGRYRPRAVLRRYIPKFDGRRRPLRGGSGRLVEKRISDRRVLKLVRQWLEAGVMEDGEGTTPVTGTPQGGVISPLLSNIYLHVLDRVWEKRHAHLGRLIRYADDFVIVCRTRATCEEASGA